MVGLITITAVSLLSLVLRLLLPLLLAFASASFVCVTTLLLIQFSLALRDGKIVHANRSLVIGSFSSTLLMLIPRCH